MRFEDQLDWEEEILFYLKTSHLNIFYELCLTNKRIHYCKIVRKTRGGSVSKGFANLVDVKQVSYKKDTIYFLANEWIENTWLSRHVKLKHRPCRFEIKYVSDINTCQQWIDSILYEYGNIKYKWSQLKNQYGFEHPFSLKIDSEDLSKLLLQKEQCKKKIKKLFVANICLISIYCLIALIVTSIYYWTFREFIGLITLEMLLLSFIPSVALIVALFSIPTGAFSAIPGAIWFAQWRRIVERISPKYNKLILKEDEILLKSEDSRTSIPITPSMSMEFFRRAPINALRIRPYHNSDNQIVFGPIVDYNEDIYDLFYCYIYIWKKRNGYLLKKSRLDEKAFIVG